MNEHAIVPGYFGAIVWKECRELFRWGVVAMALIAAAFLWSLPEHYAPFRSLRSEGLMPFVAFVLGLIQMHRSRSEDAWAFLTLRPAGRSTLFWGKAAAGVLIYLMAAGIPFLITLDWLATPRNLSVPFDWNMAVPIASDLFLGLVFYFAALFGGMRQAPWSRFLAFMAAAAVPEAIAIVLNLRVGLTAGLFAMLIAAHGMFVAGGKYDSQPAAIRLVVGSLVALSLGALGVGTIRGIDAFLLFHPGSESDEPTGGASYRPTAAGSIVIEKWDTKGELSASDLEHRPIAQYQRAADDTFAWSYLDLVEPADSQGTFRSQPIVGPLFGTQKHPPDVQWYYVHSAGLLACYEYSRLESEKRLLGWFGPSGYHEGMKPPQERFEGHLVAPDPTRGFTEHAPVVLTLSNAAYRIDLEGHKITPIFRAPSGESLVAGTEARLGTSIFVTTKTVYVLSPDNKPLLKAARDPLAAGYPQMIVAQATGASTFIWYKAGNLPRPYQPVFVNSFDTDGAMIARYTLPSLPQRPMRWRPGMIFAAAVPVTISAMFAVARGPSESIYLYDPLNSARADLEYSGHRPAASLGQWLTGWLLSIFGSLGSAALIRKRCRKYALPSRRIRVWTTIGILLGPLGYLLMRSLLEWPALETCPSCGRGRIITRMQCEHCGEPFSPPEPDGSEIFDYGFGPIAEGLK